MEPVANSAGAVSSCIDDKTDQSMTGTEVSLPLHERLIIADDKTLKEFVTVMMVYVSHMSPMICRGSQVEFYDILFSLDLDFSPKYYLEKLGWWLSFLQKNIFPCLLVKESIDLIKIFGKGNIDIIKKIDFLLKELNIGIYQFAEINPRIVTNFVRPFFYTELKKNQDVSKNQTKEIVNLKNNRKKLENDLTSHNELIIELKRKIILCDIELNDIKKAFISKSNAYENLKKNIEIKKERKQKIIKLKKSLEIYRQNPQLKTTEEYILLKEQFEKLSTDHEEFVENAPYCSISTEPLQELKKTKQLVVTRCGHIFCKKSLMEWLVRNRICPNCREEVKRVELRDVYI